MVGDLKLIAKATDPALWLNRIEQLPLDERSLLWGEAEYITIIP
jgi:hypothetical protein